MAVSLNPDGTVDVAQQTTNPENEEKLKEEGMGDGFSETFSYKDEKAFKDDNWGELNFYGLGDGDDFKDGVYKQPGIPKLPDPSGINNQQTIDNNLKNK